MNVGNNDQRLVVCYDILLDVVSVARIHDFFTRRRTRTTVSLLKIKTQCYLSKQNITSVVRYSVRGLQESVSSPDFKK